MHPFGVIGRTLADFRPVAAAAVNAPRTPPHRSVHLCRNEENED
jgi:hypothetical protein